MKKISILIALFCFSIASIAQVAENIYFDGYVSPSSNDFTNYFSEVNAPSALSGLIQINDNGITGGCLRTPPVFTPGAEVRYCAKYRNHIGATLTTGISFKWNTGLINPSTGPFISSAVITLVSSHSTPSLPSYISGSVDSMGVVWICNASGSGGCASSEGSGVALTSFLTDGHWYNLVLGITTIGGPSNDLIGISVKIYDIGTSGTSSPTLVNSFGETNPNEAMAQDTAIGVEIKGSASGGCQYIDNFSFQGFKGAGNCITNGVPQITVDRDFALSEPAPNPSNENVRIDYRLPKNIEQGVISLYNTNGQIVNSYLVTNKNNWVSLDNSLLPTGIYYYLLRAQGLQSTAKKMVVIK
jgi:type IX secretion system substrate protein